MPVKEHPVIPQVASETVIWRFMSFAKFVSLMDTRTLYFAQAEVLAARDPFEGRYGGQNYAFAKRMEEDYEFAKKVIGGDHTEQAMRVLQKAMGASQLQSWEKILRKMFYLNCWSSSEFESAALWSVYAQETEGVAIKSTVGALRTSLEQEVTDVYVGNIRYLNYSDAHIAMGNLFSPIFVKRRSFSFESELRACLMQSPSNGFGEGALDQLPRGVLAKCNIDLLIEEIYVAPFSPRWFQGLVADVAAKYGIKKNVVRSSIADESLA